MSEKTVKVVCGANSQDVDVVGRTVAQVKEALRDVLNIADESRAIISGDNVDNEYTLRAGDVLEFVKESGEKGR